MKIFIIGSGSDQDLANEELSCENLINIEKVQGNSKYISTSDGNHIRVTPW